MNYFFHKNILFSELILPPKLCLDFFRSSFTLPSILVLSHSFNLITTCLLLLSHKFEGWGRFKALCQDFDPIVRDNHRVLKLGRPLPVHGRTGPVVAPGEIFPRPLIYHGLNREHVTLFHEPNRLVVPIVRHLGSLMENGTNAVSCVGADYPIPFWLTIVRYDIAHFSVHGVGLAILDRLHQ